MSLSMNPVTGNAYQKLTAPERTQEVETIREQNTAQSYYTEAVETRVFNDPKVKTESPDAYDAAAYKKHGGQGAGTGKTEGTGDGAEVSRAAQAAEQEREEKQAERTEEEKEKLIARMEKEIATQKAVFQELVKREKQTTKKVSQSAKAQVDYRAKAIADQISREDSEVKSLQQSMSDAHKKVAKEYA